MLVARIAHAIVGIDFRRVVRRLASCKIIFLFQVLQIVDFQISLGINSMTQLIEIRQSQFQRFSNPVFLYFFLTPASGRGVFIQLILKGFVFRFVKRNEGMKE